MDKYKLSNEDFFNIYGKVPRFNIDLAIKSEEGLLLALRSIEPSIGSWHMPGGTVYKGELIKDAAKRITKNETGLDVDVKECLGYMEFPKEIRGGNEIHTISIVIEINPTGGEIRKDENARELKYWKTFPGKMIAEHKEFIKSHRLII